MKEPAIWWLLCGCYRPCLLYEYEKQENTECCAKYKGPNVGIKGFYQCVEWSDLLSLLTANWEGQHVHPRKIISGVVGFSVISNYPFSNSNFALLCWNLLVISLIILIRLFIPNTMAHFFPHVIKRLMFMYNGCKIVSPGKNINDLQLRSTNKRQLSTPRYWSVVVLKMFEWSK